MSVASAAPALAPGALERQGVYCGLAAYLCWGFFPVYFKALAEVPSIEVLAHRILWSAVFFVLLTSSAGKWGTVVSALGDRRTRLTLGCTTLLIAVNWLVFIYAVASGHVLQASLGYFISPLVNVLLGLLVLRERLRPWQALSLGLAAAGVLVLTGSYGRFPWISLVLAGSFGTYGLLRKTARVDALQGLTVETCLLGPLALAFVVVVGAAGHGHFLAGSSPHSVLLPLAGAVTAVPLLLFTAAARRLRLATLGFLQYLTPSVQLLLAVWIYGEPFTLVHLITFSCIWAGLALYSLDTLRSSLARRVVV